MNRIPRKKSKSVPCIEPLNLKPDDESCGTYSDDETIDSDPSEISQYRVLKRPRDRKKHEYITIKKRSSKSVTFAKQQTPDADEDAIRRQRMSIKLSSSQMEESLSFDRHKSLHDQYERSENILLALQQYLDCINLELKASYRLCSELNALVVNESSVHMTDEMSRLIRNLCEMKLVDETGFIKKKLYYALEVDENIENMAMEYIKRKKDFTVATNNFRLLLDNTRVSMPQIEHLHRQYKGILVNFQHSRCLLDQRLPCVINNRMNVLSTCLHEMESHLERASTDRSELCSLFKHLESSLNGQNDKLSPKTHVGEFLEHSTKEQERLPPPKLVESGTNT